MKQSLTEYQDHYQINAIRIISSIGVLIAFPFGLISLIRSDNYLLAVINFIAGTANLLLLLKIRDAQKPHLWAFLCLCLGYVCVCILIAIEPLDHATIIWIWTLPTVSILILGMRTGSITTLFFATIGLCIFLYRRHVAGAGEMNFFLYLNTTLSLIAIWICCSVYASKQQELIKHLNETATHDPLTQLHNRLHLTQIFKQLLDDQKKSRSPLSVLLLDIDHFKKINDRFGHDIGDRVLEQLSALMIRSTREQDWLFRLGGEEFAILLPQTNVDKAILIADRLRKAFSEHTFPCLDNNTHCTVSIGIASAPADGNDYESLYRCADERMYQAKKQGRNRVVAAQKKLSIQDANYN